MAYFEKEEIRQAKQMSAIEFLKRYRPEELVCPSRFRGQ